MESFPDDLVQFCGPKPLLWLQVLSVSLEYGYQGIRQASNVTSCRPEVMFLTSLCLACS